MNSYSEVRRVRQQMSEAVSHDVHALIAEINKRRPSVAARIIDPGTKAEQSDTPEAADDAFSMGESSPGVR
ncbi:MAG: hypothetical protein ACR2FY_10725 [Pirellulaceae bacterium]